MTQEEEKQLLLVDICTRLPYGVKCENFNHAYGKNIFEVTDIRNNGYICGTINNKHGWAVFDPSELKPYLFPLSSMTPKQKAELSMLVVDVEDIFKSFLIEVEFYCKHHIDYRGLIPMGLANDATDKNIY